MSDPIELTRAEIEAAAASVNIAGGMGFEDRRQLVETVASAINKVRGGDPLGTIRRCEDGCCVALRVNRHEGEWQFMSTETYYDREFGDTKVMNIDTWPIIFPSEAS